MKSVHCCEREGEKSWSMMKRFDAIHPSVIINQVYAWERQIAPGAY